MLQCDKAWIGLAQDTVTVSICARVQYTLHFTAHTKEGAIEYVDGTGGYLPGNDLAALERLPEILFNLIVGGIFTDSLLHLEHPSKNFLVCQSDLSCVGVRNLIWV